VISHILAPHPPLVYGPDGDHLRIDASAPFAFDWTQAAYVGQVAYLNKQVLPVVDALTTSARRPTVVVLMSDHGSRMVTPAGSSVMSPEVDRNFFATLTPGHRGLFGDSPTPVNLFPNLLNAYLGMNLPILPDRSFTSSGGDPMNVTPLPDASSP
jgi:phosphoglycerol transferase MdoB-like AlkP superfamily enzyme